MTSYNLSGAPNSRVLDFSLIRLEAAKMSEMHDYELCDFEFFASTMLPSSPLRAGRGAVAAPLPEMVDLGSWTPIAKIAATLFILTSC